MTPSTTLALLAALYHYKDINEPERLGEDMGDGAHNGSGAGADCSVLDLGEKADQQRGNFGQCEHAKCPDNT